MPIRAVIFDCDGTLLDSSSTIRRCLNETVRAFGYQEFTDEEFRTFYGHTLQEILHKRAEKIDEMVNYYRNLMLSTFKQDTRIFPHTLPVLNYLRANNIPLAVLTMRSAEITRNILTHFGIISYFQVVYGCDNTTHPKPSPEAVIEFSNLINIPIWQIAIAGDTKFDMLTAKNAGAIAIGVLWGSGKMEELLEAGADYLVANSEAFIEVMRHENTEEKPTIQI
jgi:HAD superfamily hydrolase (TIGR01549 family)